MKEISKQLLCLSNFFFKYLIYIEGTACSIRFCYELIFPSPRLTSSNVFCLNFLEIFVNFGGFCFPSWGMKLTKWSLYEFHKP